MPRGHDDKDPGSVNLDIGYLQYEIQEDGHDKFKYKPYLRYVNKGKKKSRFGKRVEPEESVGYTLHKYYLVHEDDADKVKHLADAIINIAIIDGANENTNQTLQKPLKKGGDEEPVTDPKSISQEMTIGETS